MEPAATGLVEPRVSTNERFAEILRILIKNDAIGMIRRSTIKRDEITRPGAPDHPPTQVRQILEELGPTFIKIGQLLGTRPDLVPAEYITEFKKLYDQTVPTPVEAVRRLVEHELGQPIERVFSSFEPRALASASIGQVHRARLKTGEDVVVKVQHPGIEAAMETDFRILEKLARFTERVFAKSRVWQPTEHLEELRTMIDKELDYRTEARALIRVSRNFENQSEIVIPKVFLEHTTQRVLVMEYIKGHKVEQVAPPPVLPGESRPRPTKAPPKIDADGPLIARRITHAMAKQIFVDRFFHADPSPGNVLIMENGAVAFLDWGAVGTVTRRRARTIFNLISTLARGDVEGVGRNIIDLCEVRGEVDIKAFHTDIEKLLDYYEKEEASVADPAVIEMIIHIANEHNMLLPPDFMLITRALYQFEGMCRTVDPEYELFTVLRPYVQDVMKEVMYGPERQREFVSTLITDYGELLQNLPGRIANIVRKIEKDELTVKYHLTGMTELKKANAKNTRLLSFSIITAAMILGLGVVLTTQNLAFIGSYFFLSAFLLTLWVLVIVLTTWTLWKGD
jgi:ubiquinone biosynthesis protein